MLHFRTKMHQFDFGSVPMGELSVHLRPHSWI